MMIVPEENARFIEVQKTVIPDWHPSYEQMARIEARKQMVDEELVLAIMWQESRFNPKCVSSKGAMGLMQIMPGTCKDLGINPKGHTWQENVNAGIRYVKWLQKQTDKTEHLLIAYNWGIGNLKKYINDKSVSLPKETRNYIAQVKKHYNLKPWKNKK